MFCASTEALGVSTLLEDFGCVGVKVSVGMDANAAIGIVQRRGLNNLRHVELDVLWIQEQQARRLLPLRKVPGPRNPSDMMTKNVDQAHTLTCTSIYKTCALTLAEQTSRRTYTRCGRTSSGVARRQLKELSLSHVNLTLVY